MADKKRNRIIESQRARTIRFIIIAVLIMAIVLAFYIRFTNHSRNSSQNADENMTETEILKMYDMEKQYPKTARDVVKMHCRILKCIYNEKLTDADSKQLNKQARKLFSEQLLSENVESEQLSDLEKDVEDFHSANKIYISYVVDADEDIEYSQINGKEYAIVHMVCNIKESTNTNAIEEEYLLIKENNTWKIVGWQGLTNEHGEASNE